MYKRWGYKYRTLRIEVRIGNSGLSSSYGTKQITANQKCGITSSKSHYDVETFSCIPPLDGRYMSLQSLMNEMMNIGEINVFTAGFFAQMGLANKTYIQCGFPLCQATRTPL